MFQILYYCSLILGITFAMPCFSFDGEAFYTAHLTKADRFNEHGRQLTTLNQILVQDRINYYQAKQRHAYDGADGYQSTKKLYSRLENATIDASPSLANLVKSTRDAIICVIILTPHHIELHANKCPRI